MNQPIPSPHRPAALLCAIASLAMAAPAGAAVFTWNFADLGADVAIGGTAPTMGYLDPATEAATTFGTTNGGSAIELAVPDLPDGPSTFLHHPALPNGGAAGYTLDFAPSTFAANGGGSFVNSYTLVIDLYIATLDWTAIFQTNNVHDNDADWYVANDGTIGIGALGYSAAPVVSAGTWNRLAFVHDGDLGVVRYFANGSEVYSGVGGGTDGRFSLYTSDNAGVDFLFQGEGDGSGNYTNEAWISSLMIADYAVPSGQITALGGPTAGGIIIPEPSAALLAASALALIAVSRRRASPGD